MKLHHLHSSLSVNSERPLLLLKSLWSLAGGLMCSHHARSDGFDCEVFSVRQTHTATALSFPFLVMLVIVKAAFVDYILNLLIFLRPCTAHYIAGQKLDEGEMRCYYCQPCIGKKDAVAFKWPCVHRDSAGLEKLTTSPGTG